MSGSPKWDDLAPRLGSAVAMLAVGGGAIWAGGWWFLALMVLALAVMLWELVRLSQPDNPNAALQAAALGVVSLGLVQFLPPMFTLPIVGAFLIIFLGLTRNLRAIVLPYAGVVWLACMGLLTLRLEGGLMPMLWLVSVVIMTDVAGYFAGRLIGGPKFWPAISPKKTWSGTVAGWLGAALVGWCFVPQLADFFNAGGVVAGNLIVGSVALSFASQMGDIAESAIKRRAGVKDASNLIPGHGGLLDRFDGMIGAALLISLWGLIEPLL